MREKRNKSVNLCSKHWFIPPRSLTWITAVTYSSYNGQNDPFKRLVRLHHFCVQTLSGSILAALPFLFIQTPFLLLTSHQSRPPCCWPEVHFARFPHDSLLAFRSLFNYCLIKEGFNKIATPPPWSFSIFFLCFISYIALIICFMVYLFILSFLPLAYKHMSTEDLCIHCNHLEQALLNSHHLSNEGRRSYTQPRYSLSRRREKKTLI